MLRFVGTPAAAGESSDTDDAESAIWCIIMGTLKLFNKSTGCMYTSSEHVG